MTDEPTTDYSVRFPDAFIKNELLPLYPAATTPTQAIRMAVQDIVERRQAEITSETIQAAVLQALDEFAEDVTDVDQLEILEAGTVSVKDVENLSLDAED